MSEVRAGVAGTRPYIDKAQPQVYAALLETAKASREASRRAGLEVALLELVNVRVSQLNGCVTCLSVHTPAARHAGVSELEIDLLPAWRAADLYTEEQRCALALAEAVTRPDEEQVVHAQRAAATHFSPEALAALEWAIVLINSFNRVSIVSGHPPRRAAR